MSLYAFGPLYFGICMAQEPRSTYYIFNVWDFDLIEKLLLRADSTVELDACKAHAREALRILRYTHCSEMPEEK